MNTKEMKNIIEHNFADLHTGELQELIGLLHSEYERTLRDELGELKGRHEEYAVDHPEYDDKAEFKKELAKMAYHNASNWSGGNSVHNMIEQIKREAALSLLAY